MTPDELSRHYDAMLPERLKDLDRVNPRVELLRWMLEHEVEPGESVLDLGCGIGWSTHTLRSLGASAIGVDLSPANVDEARRRFGGDFRCADVCSFRMEQRFTTITVLDCLEHLPGNLRPGFYGTVLHHLEPGGSLLLNLPNPAFLRHLDAHAPHALQPVDEPVDLEEIQRHLGPEFVLATAILYGIDVEDQYLWYRFRRHPGRWNQSVRDPWERIPPWPAPPPLLRRWRRLLRRLR